MNVRNSIIDPIKQVQAALTELRRDGIVVSDSVVIHVSLPQAIDAAYEISFETKVTLLGKDEPNTKPMIPHPRNTPIYEV